MHVVIVEDEATVAQRIERLVIEILGDEISRVRRFEFLDEALQYIQSKSIDLLLIDLNLHGKDGFDLIKHMNAYSFYTIIISAYSDRAIEAFEYGVLDFIPKPFSKQRLKKALKKLNSRDGSQKDFLKKIAIRHKNRFHFIDLKDVLFIKGAGGYSEVNLHSGKVALHDKSLDKIIRLLPPNFERVHKSYIVNMKEIKNLSYTSGSKYELTTKSGIRLPVGRTRYKELKEKWI